MDVVASESSGKCISNLAAYQKIDEVYKNLNDIVFNGLLKQLEVRWSISCNTEPDRGCYVDEHTSMTADYRTVSSSTPEKDRPHLHIWERSDLKEPEVRWIVMLGFGC